MRLTIPVRFGKVFIIHSQAADAYKRADALVEQKRQQDIDAEASGPDRVFPEDAGKKAFVYTNEDDKALDCFRQLEETREEAYRILLDEKHKGNDVEQSFEALFFGPDAAVTRAKAALETCFEKAEKLYFDKDGKQINSLES
jgi:hypothetical protein